MRCASAAAPRRLPWAAACTLLSRLKGCSTHELQLIGVLSDRQCEHTTRDIICTGAPPGEVLVDAPLPSTGSCCASVLRHLHQYAKAAGVLSAVQLDARVQRARWLTNRQRWAVDYAHAGSIAYVEAGLLLVCRGHQRTACEPPFPVRDAW